MTSVGRRAAAAALALVMAACTGETAAPPTSPSPSGTRRASASPTASPTRDRPFDASRVSVSLRRLRTTYQQPVLVTHAGDGSGRLYVVEQRGRIYSSNARGGNNRRFLDIIDRVGSGGERGLLGLAFHPRDRARLFVNYTNRAGDTIIAEFTRDGTQADADSERRLLKIDQPFANHNGGMLAFGPDGYLYIATGDGGSAGDPRNRGQRLNTLLGKILRIDVNGGRPYGVPDDNPFVDRDGARPEIWAYGLRNPWRFSFDRETGDMFIGDVGQNMLEEIDFQPAGRGGRNYGWRIMEGDECYRRSGCDRDGLVRPVVVYPTDIGCAVTGGYVYRGSRYPALRGAYLFADYCSGDMWSIPAARAARDKTRRTTIERTGLSISSFGEDEAGEMYVTDLAGGGVYRITARER